MERKQIKIGEAYGVVASRSTRRPGNPVRATVLGFDGEFEQRTGRWSGTATRTTGIRVKFDEPMVRQWDEFCPLAKYERQYAADEVTTEQIEMQRARAVTEAVLEAAQMVTEPWADYTRRLVEREEWADKQARDMDERGDKIEPRVAAVKDVFDRVGIDPKTKTYTGAGVERTRTIGAYFTFTLEQVEAMVGTRQSA